MIKMTCYLCLQRYKPLKGGVNDMPFRLKDVLSKCGLHIGSTLMEH
jgi:hypothetical protein